jgi:hypothetical protein
MEQERIPISTLHDVVSKKISMTSVLRNIHKVQ